MKRLPQLLFVVLPLVLVVTATAAELPKELRTAEVMIQDGLGRDAIPRLRTYLTKWRRGAVGFIFQSYHLIP